MSQRTQVIVLVVVLAALVAAIAWQRERGREPHTTAAAGARRASETAGDVPFTAEDVPVVAFVRAEPLPGENVARQAQRGNLFVYTRSPEELADEQRRAEEARLAAEEARRQADIARKEQEERDRIKRDEDARIQREKDEWERAHPKPPPPPTPPSFRYQYVGIVGPKEDALAILSDGGTKYSYARAGDVIDKAFRVERVTSLSLDVTYTDPRFAEQFEQVPRTFAAAAAPADRATPTPRKQR